MKERQQRSSKECELVLNTDYGITKFLSVKKKSLFIPTRLKLRKEEMSVVAVTFHLMQLCTLHIVPIHHATEQKVEMKHL